MLQSDVMESIHLRLPATSANLGPGFDAVGLAMSLYLDIKAEASTETTIQATGRNSDVVSTLQNNLILATYRELAPNAPEILLTIHNDVPIGMGCGSSALALLAGVLLANHFGQLGLTQQQILEEACVREGHPDNVSACLHGGMTVSSMQGRKVTTATFGEDLPWRLLLALPAASFSTEKARALLPPVYSRADTVANLQATALLVSAFAKARPELLRIATLDRLHQPYRSESCPLLPLLLPLAQHPLFCSVSLSGAGPSVLLIAASDAGVEEQMALVREYGGAALSEVLQASIVSGSACFPYA